MKRERILISEATPKQILAWCELLNLDVDGRNSPETLLGKMRDAGHDVDDPSHTIPIVTSENTSPPSTASMVSKDDWRRFDKSAEKWVPCNVENIALYELVRGSDGKGSWQKVARDIVYLHDIKYGQLEYREDLGGGQIVTARLGQTVLIQTEKRQGGDRPVKLNTNSRGLLVPRGKPHWIPVEYLDNLKNAVERRFEQSGDSDQINRESPRFAVNYAA